MNFRYFLCILGLIIYSTVSTAGIALKEDETNDENLLPKPELNSNPEAVANLDAPIPEVAINPTRRYGNRDAAEGVSPILPTETIVVPDGIPPLASVVVPEGLPPPSATLENPKDESKLDSYVEAEAESAATSPVSEENKPAEGNPPPAPSNQPLCARPPKKQLCNIKRRSESRCPNVCIEGGFDKGVCHFNRNASTCVCHYNDRPQGFKVEYSAGPRALQKYLAKKRLSRRRPNTKPQNKVENNEKPQSTDAQPTVADGEKHFGPNGWYHPGGWGDSDDSHGWGGSSGWGGWGESSGWGGWSEPSGWGESSGWSSGWSGDNNDGWSSGGWHDGWSSGDGWNDGWSSGDGWNDGWSSGDGWNGWSSGDGWNGWSSGDGWNGWSSGDGWNGWSNGDGWNGGWSGDAWNGGWSDGWSSGGWSGGENGWGGWGSPFSSGWSIENGHHFWDMFIPDAHFEFSADIDVASVLNIDDWWSGFTGGWGNGEGSGWRSNMQCDSCDCSMDCTSWGWLSGWCTRGDGCVCGFPYLSNSSEYSGRPNVNGGGGIDEYPGKDTTTDWYSDDGWKGTSNTPPVQDRNQKKP